MKRTLRIAAAAVLIVVGSSVVQADTIDNVITDDAFLASPNGTPANDVSNPAFYNGTGNPNGGFTVSTDTDSGIELGLRAKLRQNPAVIDSTDNTYIVPAGPQTNVTSGGNGASATHAAWNYEFSIDLRPNGVGTLTLADIGSYTTLTIQDLTQSTSVTVNPLTYWIDDSGYGANGTGPTNTAKDSPESAGDWGAQNSENPQFADFPLASGYNINGFDDYEFTLSVGTSGGTLASDTIFVDVVAAPLPATFWTGSILLVGTMGMYYRRGRQPQPA